MRSRESYIEFFVDLVLYSVLCMIGIITLYPLIYVFSMSISDPINAASNNVIFLPKGFSLDSYKLIMQSGKLWNSYYNSLWYAGFGTALNIFMTVTAGYVLSRSKFCLRKVIMVFIVITMFFSGGMIPNYILINNLGLYNTRLAMILPVAVAAYYIIISRTFMQSNIPESLIESAFLDGANDIYILYKIILPLSKALIAVLVIFYAIGHWNSYFNALLYLSSARLQPLQIFLRNVLFDEGADLAGSIAEGYNRSIIVQQTKYAAIIVVILPITMLYPFAQKYFVKGVMIGSIK